MSKLHARARTITRICVPWGVLGPATSPFLKRGPDQESKIFDARGPPKSAFPYYRCYIKMLVPTRGRVPPTTWARGRLVYTPCHGIGPRGLRLLYTHAMYGPFSKERRRGDPGPGVRSFLQQRCAGRVSPPFLSHNRTAPTHALLN